MEKEVKSPNLNNFFSNILFVSDLPKETKNQDLEHLFSKYHFLKSSLKNSKMNNIYAEVILENEEYADKARHELNGYILIPEDAKNDKSKGKPIRICKYESKFNNNYKNYVDYKKNLCVKNLDINMTQKEFYNIFLKYGDILSAKIEYDETGKSRGFGFIYYYEETSAKNAMINLNGKEFYKKKIEIENFNPSKKKKDSDLTVFINNLPFSITEKTIKSIFEKYGEIISIKLTDKGYAYITYNSKESISKCLEDIKKNPISFSGLPEITVKYALPKKDKKNNIIENNFNKNEDSSKVFFKLIKDDDEEINNEIELDKSIRLFIKIIFITEYIPKFVEINMSIKGGIIHFNSKHDCKIFLQKYNIYCSKNKPMFFCTPYNKIKSQIDNNINLYNIGNNNEVKLLNSNLNNSTNINIKNNIINTPLMNNSTNNLFPNDLRLKEIYNNQNKFYPNPNIGINNSYYKSNNLFLNSVNKQSIIPNFNKKINLNNNYINGNININQQKYNNNKYINNYQLNTKLNQQPLKFHQENMKPNKEMLFNPEQFNYQTNYINYSIIKKSNDYDEIFEKLHESIYNIVQKKHPKEAGTIAGIIKNLGAKKMISLLSNPEQLDKIIEQAYNIAKEKEDNDG